MIDDAMIAMMQAAHRCEPDRFKHKWDVACAEDRKDMLNRPSEFLREIVSAYGNNNEATVEWITSVLRRRSSDPPDQGGRDD